VLIAEAVQRHSPWWRFPANALVIVATAYLCFIFLGTGAWLARGLDPSIRREVVITVGPRWVTMTSLIAAALYLGHRFIKVGGEFDREWLGRLSAFKIMPTLLWLVLAATCLLLPQALIQQEGTVWNWIVAASAAISGPIAVLGGRSALSVVGSAVTPTQRKRAAPFNLLVTVATFVFLLALLMLLAWAEIKLAVMLHDRWAQPLQQSEPYVAGDGHLLRYHLAILGALLVVIACASLRIKVNRFSLHALYRNRLMRAFLGGALPPRPRDSFTGLDFRDDVRLASLKNDGDNRLFHVINVAMNLAGSARGAQQERKAESFTLTPLLCGSAKLDLNASSGGEPTGAYFSSEDYGGDEPYTRDASYGVHLATAITISGAAANSSMGYNSSPATALLLTLFNVRLGCWLPNPAWPGARLPDRRGWHASKIAHYRRAGPRNALRPLVVELLGRTSDQSAYLQLSDGGHFENLGIYEMVRRRCRFMLVSDAECDPDGQLEGLGNAVRKCRIDFGVDIRFTSFPIGARGTGGPQDGAFAVGRVLYPEGPEGVLLYVKASFYDLPEFSRGMPADVRHYSVRHLDFPHETTGDQWFTESQFESYRKLGLEIADRMLQQLRVRNGQIDSLVDAAQRMGRLPARAML
jgi:hypothetical protein